jgi:hypothetical protein
VIVARAALSEVRNSRQAVAAKSENACGDATVVAMHEAQSELVHERLTRHGERQVSTKSRIFLRFFTLLLACECVRPGFAAFPGRLVRPAHTVADSRQLS